MNTAGNKILNRMLDRLFNSLMNGPSLNCRPHSSRQRIDWVQLGRLQDASPEQCLQALLSPARRVTVKAAVPPPPRKPNPEDESEPETPDQQSTREKAEKAWADQRGVLGKLRTIVEDGRTYEQDTGVHVLSLGYPLLTLPPGSLGPRRQSNTRRIVAPVAFIPVNISVKAGLSPSIDIACTGDDIDLVTPNAALVAWLEQQTGKAAQELFNDEQGADPWRELQELTAHAARVLGMDHLPDIRPPDAEADDDAAAAWSLQPAPRADEDAARPAIIPAAVLGLFPLTNQGLLRDTQALVAGEELGGPIESFVELQESPNEAAPSVEAAPAGRARRSFAAERHVVAADPCQARAVRLAQSSSGLVVHGPPGTGKSQTITNIIGDHLARGQRVLVVCDKRTAVDVVVNRLSAIGLGELCAVVHDPQRDQRDLYKSIRAQLDDLVEARLHTRAAATVAKTDAELDRLHQDLAGYHAALSDSPADGDASLHDMVGQWFSISADGVAVNAEPAFAAIPLSAIESASHDLRDILGRGRLANLTDNPWAQAAGIPLADFLARPMETVRQALSACTQAARRADESGDETIPPFDSTVPLDHQLDGRRSIQLKLEAVISQPGGITRSAWAAAERSAIESASKQLVAAEPHARTLQETPLDAEFALLLQPDVPALSTVNTAIAAVESYLAVCGKWYAFLQFGAKKRAASALAPWGLTLNRENAERGLQFLKGLRARLVLTHLHQAVLVKQGSQSLLPDETLARSYTEHAALFALLIEAHAEHNRPLLPLVQAALQDATAAAPLVHGLQKSAARAQAIAALELALQSANLFDEAWIEILHGKLCANETAHNLFQELEARVGTLENALRVREGLARLPQELRAATGALVEQGISPEAGEQLLRKAALANAIAQRVRQDPQLQQMDGHRIKSSFEQYRSLEAGKRAHVRDAILCHWRTRQRERLLAMTGSRLNSAGADMRRRLILRGQRALRLRQVIALGEQVEGGDPLFDLRPVWMASPETVAQIFPRRPLFDAVIFDEASQCRLEEALPVLVRGKRVVVAGDPKQLPPTRFFESAMATAEEDEVENASDLFEAQQSEVEDLLTAALNLDIQESYLDVHYRSRNADLIGFSNEQFYGSRLQPIPGHPANRTRYSPITLYRVDGTYDERANLQEADEVCRIVGDLLKRAAPPSIGIACFNTTQRDLIIERLEAVAEDDADFRRRLQQARGRTRNGASEGLFVKNLENVQGDERDHIIISTTYGPDPNGKFYQRFGPLGSAGGGRRLNVLVTRAKEELHLVTSIPQAYYHNLVPIPPGQTPGGGWLLYAFLKYAEWLQEAYDEASESAGEQERQRHVEVHLQKTRWPSALTESIASHLAQVHNSGGTAYWGNDGFCVDLALHHPKFADDVTIGIICDTSRYETADDPVEWEVFRTAVLESQGWRLHRIWSPHFFRDPQGGIQNILADVQNFLATERHRDALPVTPTE